MPCKFSMNTTNSIHVIVFSPGEMHVKDLLFFVTDTINATTVDQLEGADTQWTAHDISDCRQQLERDTFNSEDAIDTIHFSRFMPQRHASSEAQMREVRAHLAHLLEVSKVLTGGSDCLDSLSEEVEQ
eukprot:m.160359 g.160359  ORF g.160359 m.160359 type:complete len:128 (-) comp14349_c0_seq2:125-508(-)